MKRFAVVGLGNFGLELARVLSRLGAQVLAVDNDPGNLDRVKDLVHTAVRMDARDRETLEAQGVHEVDAAVVCMGEDFEAAEMCAVHLIDLGCPRVIIRATSRDRLEILEALGPEVITPGMEAARVLGAKLASGGLRDYARFAGGQHVAEVVVPEGMEGKTIGSVSVAGWSKVKVLVLRRGLTAEAEQVVGPSGGQALRAGDNLLLLGAESDLIRVGGSFA